MEGVLLLLNGLRSTPLYSYLSLQVSRSRVDVSWPVSSSFAIFHVDITLINVMSGISQFAVVVFVSDETSAILTTYFINMY